MLKTAFLIIVGLAFIILGSAKLLGAKPLKEAFATLKLPQWLRYPIGVLELLGGAAFCAGAFLPPIVFFAAIPLSAITAGAVLTHIFRPPFTAAIPALGLTVALGIGVYMQPLGLQIVSLPSQDDMPSELLQSTVLETFEPGTFLESVSVLPDGSLVIAATRGINFMTFDFSAASGSLIRWTSEGEMSTLLDLPVGLVAGVSAVAPDGSIYMTVTGAAPAVWRISPDGSSGEFARAPEGIESLNGLALGPDGNLYAAADLQGAILRLNPQTGSFEVVFQDTLLGRRSFFALAPGINGLEFFGQDLLVTVSDSAKVYSTTLQEDGSFSTLVEIASGVPGDDLAIAADGTAYITTHPYNSVVRLDADGTRTLVSDASTNATGSTDVVLSVDGRSLFMVTDGGAFSGMPNATGQLVRVTLQE